MNRNPAWCQCGKQAMSWTCCGHSTDGRSGGGCRHAGGVPVCDACWRVLAGRGEVSGAGDTTDQKRERAERALKARGEAGP